MISDEEKFRQIRREFQDASVEREKVMPKDSLLHKHVQSLAETVGVPFNNKHVVVTTKKEKPNAATSPDAIYISSDFLSTKSDLATLNGVIKHELAHQKQGFLRSYMNSFLLAMGKPERALIAECEADFAAGKDIIRTWDSQLLMNPPHYFTSGIDNQSHPQYKDRMRAALTKDFIEQLSGLELKVEDVAIKPDCSFDITNQDKLEKISPRVIQQARDGAEIVMKNLDRAISNNLERFLGIERPPATPAPAASAPAASASGAAR